MDSMARVSRSACGALSGKHLNHIDRIGAYTAREAAVRAVRSGADECLVRLAYHEPIDVFDQMSGRGERSAGSGAGR